jgi:hypothetical protein
MVIMFSENVIKLLMEEGYKRGLSFKETCRRIRKIQKKEMKSDEDIMVNHFDPEFYKD